MKEYEEKNLTDLQLTFLTIVLKYNSGLTPDVPVVNKK